MNARARRAERRTNALPMPSANQLAHRPRMLPFTTMPDTGVARRVHSLAMFKEEPPAFVRRHVAADLAKYESAFNPAEPSECQANKVVIIPTVNHGGIGNALNQIALRVESSFRLRMTAILNSSVHWSGWDWADSSPGCVEKASSPGADKRLGFECFFRPLSSCRDFAAASNAPADWNLVRTANRAKALRYFMRPNDRMVAYYYHEYAKFWSAVDPAVQRNQLITVQHKMVR